MTELELTANLFKLADMGITGLEANYEIGEDDYISLGHVYYTTDIVKETKRPLFVSAVKMLDTDMNDLFREHIINNVIKTHIFEFNGSNGSSGDIYMFAPSGYYEVIHRKNVVTYIVSHHNGDLINNTLEKEK